MPFKKVVQTFGFPLVSKEVSQKVNELKHTNGKKTRLLRYYGNHKGDSKLSNEWKFLAEQKFDVTHKCCQKLKKDPLEKWAKKNGGLKPIIALMKDESRLRQQLALYGDNNGKKIYPFLDNDWTEEDVWLYAELFNIRFAECYYDRIIDGQLIKKRTRTGCEYCMFGITLEKEDRFETSKILAPKRYENMMALENNGVTFKTAMNLVKYSERKEKLGLYGGVVSNIELINNKEVYTFDIISDVVSCPCCGKKGSKTATKDYKYVSSFIDTPNPLTGNKRVIECHYYISTCKKCGMTLNNNLHLFDMKYNVTLRLIDYIFENLEKIGEEEIINKTGISADILFEMIDLSYNKIFKEAKEKNFPSVWFDSESQIISLQA